MSLGNPPKTVRADALPTEVFRSTYLRKEPVVIADGASSWRAFREWTPEYLKNVLGDMPFVVHHNAQGHFNYNPSAGIGPITRYRMPFSEAAEVIGKSREYYLDQQTIRSFPKLVDDLGEIPHLADRRIEMVNFWFGADGVKTSLHHDMSDNFFVQIHGRKRLWLFSPEESANLYPAVDDRFDHLSKVDVFAPDLEKHPLYAKAQQKLLYTVVEPGNIVYIPVGWWHALESIGVSISVNYWWAEESAQEVGAIGWIELETPSVDVSRAFYGELFGWSFEQGADGSATAKVGRYPVAGMRKASSDTHCWKPYFSVTELAAARATAREHGGNVQDEGISRPGYGKVATYAEPTGAPTGLFEREGLGAEALLGELFALSGVELITPDLERATAHLQAVFGIRSGPMPGAEKRVALRTRGSVRGLATENKSFSRAEWVATFASADCDRTVERAKAMGAEVIAPAADLFFGTARRATLRDPQGALFAVVSTSGKALGS